MSYLKALLALLKGYGVSPLWIIMNLPTIIKALKAAKEFLDDLNKKPEEKQKEAGE